MDATEDPEWTTGEARAAEALALLARGWARLAERAGDDDGPRARPARATDGELAFGRIEARKATATLEVATGFGVGDPPLALLCHWTHSWYDECQITRRQGHDVRLELAWAGPGLVVGAPGAGAATLRAGDPDDALAEALRCAVLSACVADLGRALAGAGTLDPPRDGERARLLLGLLADTDPGASDEARAAGAARLAAIGGGTAAAFGLGDAPEGRRELELAVRRCHVIATMGDDPTARDAVGRAAASASDVTELGQAMTILLFPGMERLVARLLPQGQGTAKVVGLVAEWALARQSDDLLAEQPEGEAPAIDRDVVDLADEVREGWFAAARRSGAAMGTTTRRRGVGRLVVLGVTFEADLEMTRRGLDLRLSAGDDGDDGFAGDPEDVATPRPVRSLAFAVRRARPGAGAGPTLVVPRGASVASVATLLAHACETVAVPELALRLLGGAPSVGAGAGPARAAAAAAAPPEPAGAKRTVRLFDREAVLREAARDGDDDDVARARSRRLRRIAEAPTGEARGLVVPGEGVAEALDALGRRAPHLAEATGIVRRHVLASRSMGTPLRLPPLALVGEPGTGKTWFMAQVAAALGVPFRSYPLSMQSLAEGLTGSHPVWRAAGMGLVAATLLEEDVANPLFLVDEIDKAVPTPNNGDPHRAFYSLLEPEGARAFRDEYLGFPMRADGVMWVATANDVGSLPGPIVDRLTIVEVPPLDPEVGAVVVASVYAAANDRCEGFFAAEPSAALVAALAGRRPREMRVAVEAAMVEAAASGRREVDARDLAAPRVTRGPMGFRIGGTDRRGLPRGEGDQ